MFSLVNGLFNLSARPDSFRFPRVGRAPALVLMAAIALAFCATQGAVGAAINYGDLEGDTVWYRGVTEDALTDDDAPPLYGAPTVTGDSLDFDPVGFDANATGAGGNDITDGQLKFIVEAKGGENLVSLTISESGDTTLSGFGTDATFTGVTATGVLDIFFLNGIAVDNISVPFALDFTPVGGVAAPTETGFGWGLGSDGGGGPAFNTIWNGSVSFDLNDVLADNGFPDSRATKIGINMNNTLTALSEDGTSSLIAKKDVGGLSITVKGPNPNPGGEPVIPEPTSAALVLLGVVALMAGRRRL